MPQSPSNPPAFPRPLGHDVGPGRLSSLFFHSPSPSCPLPKLSPTTGQLSPASVALANHIHSSAKEYSFVFPDSALATLLGFWASFHDLSFPPRPNLPSFPSQWFQHQKHSAPRICFVSSATCIHSSAKAHSFGFLDSAPATRPSSGKPPMTLCSLQEQVVPPFPSLWFQHQEHLATFVCLWLSLKLVCELPDSRNRV